MTNFDFLKSNTQFDSFSTASMAAEKILHIDEAASVLNCRRAMEFAVKWMYSVDKSLVQPYQDTLVCLMSTEEFRNFVGIDLWRRMDFIRKMGNQAAHKGKKITLDKAKLCIENLYIFMDFVACCYDKDYIPGAFNPELLTNHTETAVDTGREIALDKLIVENKKLREELTARREKQQQTYVPKPLELSEYQTRKLYIDVMLADAGWTEGKDWISEVELAGMPNKSGIGYVDYVLYGDDGIPLAIIEAKRTCTDVSKGRQQAKLYADLIEQKYKQRPVVFLSNGFDTRINDNCYHERKVAAIYSKRDLEKHFTLKSHRTSLKNIVINKDIAGRYYQEAAVKAICDSFSQKNRRKALLVMATGSGKTRTVISLCDVLLNNGWIKNILFLADRNSLVTQAKRSFVNLLPNLSVTNLCEEKENYSARCVFSTYQTMINCIDTVKDEEGKLYTCGHFDLVICDEAHRSIYNKYKDIFTYFDAPLIGLTATPKDEIDKNTYEIFELENGVPTYGYELSQAVKDGYLVNYLSVETQMKFIEQGIVYDELSEEDKAAYEDTFKNENGEIPERISSSKLNEWVFNEDTIKQVLHIVMSQGLKVDYGEKIGKTIIFARNHDHAEKILEIFNKEYPELTGYATVIDNYITYVQSAIDEFSEPDKLPRIAISVDMLDTGIDIPEILNLVFFKKVVSKAKFWQMIGRGTRLCMGLLDGEDKKQFYIFDFCGNFEFFRMSKGKPTTNTLPLQGAIFQRKAQLIYKLQDITCQTEELISFRDQLIMDMVSKVSELNRNHFAVRQHIKYVDLYSDLHNYNPLQYEDTIKIVEELAPLIQPDIDDAKAVRFDALIYGLELAYLEGNGYFKRALDDLYQKVKLISGIANIPEIRAQSDLILKILHTDYLENAGMADFEFIRESLRGLMKYIIYDKPRYDTNFDDDILSSTVKEPILENSDLQNYKAKVEFYIRDHQNNEVISKLKSNVPLTKQDMEILEDIIWNQLGTKQEYEAEYQQKPLGELVREIVGLDMNAAKEAFAVYLNKVHLDSRQIYFVNQIVEFFVHNGIMKDFAVLQEAPFTDKGSIVEVFSNMSIWMDIKKIIEQINRNAIA